MKYRIVITQTAKIDIWQVVRWWSENRSSQQAERWYNRIFPAIATLSKQPDRCPLAQEVDLLDTPLRQLHFGVSRKITHRILFTITGQDVVILRVRHIAQNDLSADDLPWL